MDKRFARNDAGRDFIVGDNRIGVTMLRILIIFAFFATPCFAQEPPAPAQPAAEQPDTLALNEEDAQTCKVKACRTITDGAYELIAERLRQAERLEAIAQALAAEMKKKPVRSYCI